MRRFASTLHVSVVRKTAPAQNFFKYRGPYRRVSGRKTHLGTHFTMHSEPQQKRTNPNENLRVGSATRSRHQSPVAITPESKPPRSVTLGKFADTPHVVQTWSYEEIDELQIDAIKEHAKRLGRPLSILEAGCGQSWTLDLSGVEYTLTGVDRDPVALELRKTMARDLDVAIMGDICSVQLPEASFDVVYSCFVLEHVPQADVALQNFVRWLKPNGLLILRVPEIYTARGFLVRALPHSFHVLFYRCVLGCKRAGQPGFAPYPTYYHPVIGRERLCRFLSERRVRCLGSYGDGFRRDGLGIMQLLVRGVVKITSMLSFGRLTDKYTDLLYIAVKEPL
jgi:SAM-dependent methyltransferase